MPTRESVPIQYEWVFFLFFWSEKEFFLCDFCSLCKERKAKWNEMNDLNVNTQHNLSCDDAKFIFLHCMKRKKEKQVGEVHVQIFEVPITLWNINIYELNIKQFSSRSIFSSTHGLNEAGESNGFWWCEQTPCWLISGNLTLKFGFQIFRISNLFKRFRS